MAKRGLEHPTERGVRHGVAFYALQVFFQLGTVKPGGNPDIKASAGLADTHGKPFVTVMFKFGVDSVRVHFIPHCILWFVVIPWWYTILLSISHAKSSKILSDPWFRYFSECCKKNRYEVAGRTVRFSYSQWRLDSVKYSEMIVLMQ